MGRHPVSDKRIISYTGICAKSYGYTALQIFSADMICAHAFFGSTALRTDTAWFKIIFVNRMENTMIKAAIFDMDGTIYDTERISMEGWYYACKPYGIEITFEQICAMHGHNAHDNGVRFCSWFGEDAPYWDIRNLRYEYMNHYFSEHPVPIKPGLFELLDELKKKNIKIAIATGTSRDVASGYWESTGVLPYLSASVCGDDVSKSKPNPEIFLKAADAVGVLPEECMIFEDSRDGILGARTAGSMVFLIPDQEPVTDDVRNAADYILPSLLDAVPIVRAFPAV